MGWLSVVRIDVEDTEDERLMIEYCPPCAEAVFGRRRNVERREAHASEAARDVL